MDTGSSGGTFSVLVRLIIVVGGIWSSNRTSGTGVQATLAQRVSNNVSRKAVPKIVRW